MRTAPVTILDEALPRFDFGSRHSRRIAASPEAVWRAIEEYDFRRDASLTVRWLFRLRGLRVRSGRIRDALGKTGFAIIGERPGSEVVAATLGRFWAVREQANMERPANLEAFREFDRPGWAKGALSFRVEPLGDGATLLVTETRVECVDDRARHRFAAYWRLIRTFSGWIRRDLLAGIARKAEERT